jgi:transcriptional regulator with XRE-family HTH domain
MESVAERLKEERVRLGASQSEFAELVGVSKVTQSRYESGDRSPDTDYWQAAADAGLDVLYVLTGQHMVGNLSRDEAALIDSYRHADPLDQAAARRLFDSLAQLRRKIA